MRCPLRRQASAERAPALLDVVSAFAASRNLAPLLADAPSVRGVPEAFPPARLSEPWAAEQHLGTQCAASDPIPSLCQDVIIGVRRSPAANPNPRAAEPRSGTHYTAHVTSGLVCPSLVQRADLSSSAPGQCAPAVPTCERCRLASRFAIFSDAERMPWLTPAHKSNAPAPKSPSLLSKSRSSRSAPLECAANPPQGRLAR